MVEGRKGDLLWSSKNAVVYINVPLPFIAVCNLYVDVQVFI